MNFVNKGDAMTAATTEGLTTGWEPEVPPEDSFLRRYLFSWARQCEAFAVAASGFATRGPTFAAADYRRPSGFFNSAVLLQPPQLGSFDATMAAIESFFAGGTGEALLWSAWPTPDLRERGWHLHGHPPLLIRPPAQLDPSPAAPPVRLCEVADAAGLTHWERVAIEGYPLSELVPAHPGSLADPRLLDDDRLRFTLGWDGDEPVSAAALFVEDGMGCFVLDVTQPAARRRGHWLAHAVARLQAAPDVWMAGVFSDDSRRSAERLGFVPVLRLTLWGLPRLG